MGYLIGAVQHGDSLAGPLTAFGIVFVALQVLNPIHNAVSADLGDRMAAWLYDELTETCLAPPGIGHLEDAELANDLQVAREFDRGMTGPPLRISLGFIADGLALMLGGLASAAILFGFAWWAPPLLAGAWLATHWLLRESGVWKDRNTEEVRSAQRDAEYAYRLAVDPPAAKELRLFGLRGWTLDRFIARRTRLHELQYEATRMRERSVLSSLVIVLAANLFVFWQLALAANHGRLRAGPAGGLRPGRPGHGGHRLRWPQLGPGRRRRPGGRRPPPAQGDGPGGRVAPRRPGRRRAAGERRSTSATSASPTRGPPRRSWPGST